MIDRLLDKGRAALADELVLGLLGPAPTVQVQARLRSMIEGTRYETMVASILGMKERADRSALLPRIEVPALVIGGAEDAVIPPDVMRAMAKEIPGARTSILADAGHLPPLERPDGVNEALIELLEGRKVVWWR
jgi:pimeloyl-ACP methyl ester carboxylesterase